MAFRTTAQIRTEQNVKSFITDGQLSFSALIAESEIKQCIGNATYTNVKDDDDVIYAHVVLTHYYALVSSARDVKREQDEMSPTNLDAFNEYFSPKDFQAKLDQLRATAKMLLKPYCQLDLTVTTAETQTVIGGAYAYTPTKTNVGGCFGCD
jgi:hypothetical protein